MSFETNLSKAFESIEKSFDNLFEDLRKLDLPHKRTESIQQSVKSHLSIYVGDRPLNCSKEDFDQYIEYVFIEFMSKIPLHILSMRQDSYLGKFIKYWYTLSLSRQITSKDDPIYIIFVLSYINEDLKSLKSFMEGLTRDRKIAAESTKH